MHHRHQVRGAEVKARHDCYVAQQAQQERDATQQAILGQLQQLNSRPDYDTSRYVTRSQAQLTHRAGEVHVSYERSWSALGRRMSCSTASQALLAM